MAGAAEGAEGDAVSGGCPLRGPPMEEGVWDARSVGHKREPTAGAPQRGEEEDEKGEEEVEVANRACHGATGPTQASSRGRHRHRTSCR